jgi:phage FluMu protein Com
MNQSHQVIACCHCGKVLRDETQYVGSAVACPHCWGIFLMPDTSKPATATTYATVNAKDSDPTENSDAAPKMGQKITLHSPRPSGVTILATLGLIFSGIGLLLGIWGLIYEVPANFDTNRLGSFQYRPDGSAIVLVGLNIVLIMFVVFCLFMMGFLQVCLGLLKRKNYARRSFYILASLIIFAVITKFALAAYYHSMDFTSITGDFFEMTALLYLVVGLIYLRTKGVKNWFNQISITHQAQP